MVQTHEEILVVVFGNNRRVYARRYKLRSYASKYPGKCLRKEAVKAEAEGMRPTGFEFEQVGGFFVYRINFEPIPGVEFGI